ncbi:aspartic peptidase domain-containing protein [Bombardia bombarda]|uniref:Aspartic peptidase domain-containing protein n=1 Tax=Bombardia bombarda TaxID=252184 RepID=A0AA39XMR7_9PEZI|nr:aspartic peptidase domain-containing protein [Bombardia bombarda]
MRLPFLVAAVICVILLLAAPQLVAASNALWFETSGTWYGIDGDWSNFVFAIGSPAQIVYISPATTLSEIWVVESTACGIAPACSEARGGTFDIKASETWSPLGPWQLGIKYNGVAQEGNGDYGLETLAFVNTIASSTTALEGVLVGAINDTNFYQGYIGLGVNQGSFGVNATTGAKLVKDPFITQLAETYGTIPSHSYGYTAGAKYRKSGTVDGVAASLVLGGYDTLRFVPHDTKFTLDPDKRFPSVRLRGVTAQVSSLDKAPTDWKLTSQALVTMNDSITATIDSSTPYLWLPTDVCERFAKALNLVWKEDLGVYVFSEAAQYLDYKNDTTQSSLSLTFSVSGYDNKDDFGHPLDMPGVVNITLPPAAFAHLLRYPFKGVVQWDNSSVPYFPLKRSTEELNGNQYIIGRAFMQEAYLITDYERYSFSLHQALFPDHASGNYSLQNIEKPAISRYPSFTPPEDDTSTGLSTGVKVGIVVSIIAVGVVLGLLFWFYCCRRRKSKKPVGEFDEKKDNQSITESEQPRSPVKRMFSIITGRKKSKSKPKKAALHEVHGSSAQPVEVGADAQHQLFEMPVPPEPIELDSNDIGDDETELGTESIHGLSEYEVTRRKLERQLQGPVPAYSPTYSQTADPEKSAQDVSLVAHYRPSDEPSPASSPTYANANSLPDSLPSPLSPHPEWTNRMFDLPSPMTVAHPFQPHNLSASGSDPGSSYSPVSPHSSRSRETFAPSSVSHSDSSNASPTSPIGSLRLASSAYQRTPIDPTRVLCLGPLPENVELPNQRPIPRIVAPSSRAVEPGLPVVNSQGHGSNDSLGSNFTEEEEGRLQDEDDAPSRQNSRPEHNARDDFPRTPRSMERIDGGSELIHVPQVADKRYSWEEEPR